MKRFQTALAPGARRRFLPRRWVGLLVGLHLAVAAAAGLDVPNGSFESPATLFVSTRLNDWQKNPKPDDYEESGGFLWDQLVGLFVNTPAGAFDHIDNCDGAQGAWLFAVPQVGIFQDYDSLGGTNTVPTHAFDVRFEPGKEYRLTAGIIGAGGGMLEGVTLTLSLYYRDEAGRQVTVAETSITNSLERFSGRTHFFDYTARLRAVQPNDAWAGRHVGIKIASTVSPELQGGYWDVDQVRLEAIEEPPLTLSYTPTGSDLRIAWPSVAGNVYQMEISTGLQSWSDYAPPQVGTGAELSLTVTTADFPQSLFRVVARPAP